MPRYEELSKEIAERIIEDRKSGWTNPYAFDERNVIRRNMERDRANVIRTAFIRDVDKIIHCPYYNRYADKTQVFSFYKNDDISRRSLHVQLVSRIARTIGNALGLNLDLIEAIALGHDIGHTPFGHAGESYLDELLFSNTRRHFKHNIHSVRVFDGIYSYNISLQTLNGIAAHDGELELSEYHPLPLDKFEKFDMQIERCYNDKSCIYKLVPCTLEGCVVRISDIIAYLGKDRQDAERTQLITGTNYTPGAIGTINAEMINNLIVNIIEHSYGKPYIQMDQAHFDALKIAKSDNYEKIYNNKAVRKELEQSVRPMMTEMYNKLLNELKTGKKGSPVFTHHIEYINGAYYKRVMPYIETEPNQLIVDYIASMTDDYFIDLYDYLFPNSKFRIKYKGYFD